VLAWNVHGLTESKKECSEFVNIIEQNDIVFLFETWANCHSNIDIDGYYSVNLYRKYQHRNAKRSSGGIALYIKENLKDGVTVVRQHYDSVIWLKLDKVFFHTENDVYICGVYIWPEDSPVYNICDVDLFEIVQNDIYDFESKGALYLMGDWNSRVGVRDDFIRYDRNIDLFDSDDYIPDVPLSRASCDKTCNSFGLRLLDLCKSSGIRIVNGRVSHDCGVGSYTFASRIGASVIDYILAKECDFVYINSFMVHDFNEWSDHCPISMSLCCNSKLDKHFNDSYCKYKWNDLLKNDFRSGLIGKLPIFNHVTENIDHSDRTCINNVVRRFTDILREVADPLFKRCISTSNSKSAYFIDTAVNDKEWFDNECLQAKQRYVEAQRVFKRLKSDYSRNQFCSLKSEYKTLVKKKRQAFKAKQLLKIEKLKNSKPREFWQYFKKNIKANR
jgi:exonuclease III